MNFLTLFEDHQILAIDKPSGLPSHTLDHSATSCESILQLERPGEKLFLAHRLDTGTSGVLLFAKSEAAFTGMRELFQSKQIQKNYFAWSEKTEERAARVRQLRFPVIIDMPLAHHAKSKKRMIVLPTEKHRHFRGKPIPAKSILHSVQEDMFSHLPAYRFDLEIVTGVMHQIRVHLDYLGFSLIGDAIYEKSDRREMPRMALHARKIAFTLNGKDYSIESVWK